MEIMLIWITETRSLGFNAKLERINKKKSHWCSQALQSAQSGNRVQISKNTFKKAFSKYGKLATKTFTMKINQTKKAIYKKLRRYYI